MSADAHPSCLRSAPLHQQRSHAGKCSSCSSPWPGKPPGDARAQPKRPRQRLRQVVEAYGCSLVEGVLTHQLKRFIIDGNKVVLNRGLPDLKAEDSQFEENEVYGIDVLVSSGEGKARVTDERETTVRLYACWGAGWAGMKGPSLLDWARAAWD